MLTWQSQLDDECWITSYSLITGKPLDEIRTKFESVTGKPYSLTPSRTWYSIANGIITEDKARTISTFTVLDFPLRDYPRESAQSPPNRRLKAVLFVGRGILTVYWGNNAHSVAFEDGFIVDTANRQPENQRPLTYKEWRHLPKNLHRRFKNWRIDYL